MDNEQLQRVQALDALVNDALDELQHGAPHIHARGVAADLANQRGRRTWSWATCAPFTCSSEHGVDIPWEGDVLIAIRNAGDAPVTVHVLWSARVVHVIRDLAPGATDWIANGTPLPCGVYNPVRLQFPADGRLEALQLVIAEPHRSTVLETWACVTAFDESKLVNHRGLLADMDTDEVVNNVVAPPSVFRRRPSLTTAAAVAV